MNRNEAITKLWVAEVYRGDEDHPVYNDYCYEEVDAIVRDLIDEEWEIILAEGAEGWRDEVCRRLDGESEEEECESE